MTRTASKRQQPLLNEKGTFPAGHEDCMSCLPRSIYSSSDSSYRHYPVRPQLVESRILLTYTGDRGSRLLDDLGTGRLLGGLLLANGEGHGRSLEGSGRAGEESKGRCELHGRLYYSCCWCCGRNNVTLVGCGEMGALGRRWYVANDGLPYDVSHVTCKIVQVEFVGSRHS